MRPTLVANSATEARADVLFRENQNAVFVRTDRMFAGLMVCQWLAGVVFAVLISPRAWAGTTSSVHLHVWAALLVGGAIVSGPLYYVTRWPGAALTRHVIAAGQILTSALLIHLTGGRIETHFHVFGSLAFLSFYRDWRVLVTGSAVAAIDHLLRGMLWPESVYGVLSATPWRVLEHAGWVAFEDLFLIMACRDGVREMQASARRRAELESEIAERRRAEEALRRSEERFARAFRTSPAASVILRLGDGVYLDVNDAWIRLTGYGREEVVGRTSDQFGLWPDGAGQSGGLRAMLVERGSLQHVEMRIRARGGEIRETLLSAERVLLGDESCILGLLEDVTERRQAERAVAQRDQALEASRLKSQFLANMSHEIRTPMNGVIGMTELVLATELTREQRQHLEMVRYSADALMVVINEILDFSKIEAGRMELEAVPFDLRECLDEAVRSLAVGAEQKGLELTLRMAPEVPHHVLGDQVRLRQVVLNVVSNAVKFTKSGEVAVTVEVEPAATDVIHVAVRDTGIGIPAEKRQTIFEAFTQADGSTTRRFGGTGLGLTICSRLVALMGGRIWVESEEGRGSTFHFTVRMAAGPQPVSIAPRLEMDALQGMPILVVDDHPTNRRILEELLSSWGVEPTTADGGPAALAVLESAWAAGRSFPLVLLDARMPEIDGFALAQRIREQPGMERSAIMMLSSSGQAGEATRCRQLGIAAYIVKPVKPAALREAMLDALGRREAPPETRRVESEPTLVGLRILLAEDNAVNQRLAARLLEKRGHEVVIAGNGREALRALETQSFDAVLMDVQMPEMDGFEATRAIRAAERGTERHVPIVAMTAHAMRGDREACLAEGMNDYVSKPISSREICEKLERVTAGKRRARTPRLAPARAAEPPFDPAGVLARLEPFAM